LLRRAARRGELVRRTLLALAAHALGPACRGAAQLLRVLHAPAA
jgi:hypothetical protein